MTAAAIVPKSLPRIVLIDLSSLFHAAWHPNENYPTAAIPATIDAIARCSKKDPNALIAICVDSRKSWRKELAPSYKAQREKLSDVFYEMLDGVKDRLRKDGRLLWESDGFEADDVIATATEEAVKRGHTVAICSADKDLMQLLRPGVIQLRTYGEWSVWGETEAEAKFGVKVSQIGDWLALVGDSSDNIKGAPGIGEKRATQMLTTNGDWAGIVKALEAGSFTPAITAALQGFDYETTRKLIDLRNDVPIRFDEIYGLENPAEGNAADATGRPRHMATGPEEGDQSREQETAPTGARETPVRDERAAAAGQPTPGLPCPHGNQPAAALGELPRPFALGGSGILTVTVPPVSHGPIDSTPAEIGDAFSGIACTPFSTGIQAVLLAPLTDDEIAVRPDDGILYMPGEAIRQRLNRAFGLGGWAVKPISTIVDREATDKKGNIQPQVFYTGQLWAHGRFVAESTGDGNWIKGNPKSDYGTALEGAKTNCISRCCKDIGMWSELRDKEFTKAWQAKNSINSPRDGWIKRPKQPIKQQGV